MKRLVGRGAARPRAGLLISSLCLVLAGCGGDSGKPAASSGCDALCSKPHTCPNDPDQSSCVQQCEALSKACTSQASALNSCTASRPDGDFACDEAGTTKLKDGICKSETDALFACVLGNGTADLGGDVSSGAASTPDESGSAPSTPSSSSSTSAAPTTQPTSPTPSSTIDCAKTCGKLVQLGCNQSAADCEAQCQASIDQLAASGCQPAYVALEVCAEADVSNNFECQDDAPKIKQTVCVDEQGAFVSCLTTGVSSPETSSTCAQYCADGNTFNPPISCANDSTLSCESTCSVALTPFEAIGCSDALLAYTKCSTQADASHWSCDDQGTAQFDNAVCTTEADTVTACLFGGLQQ